MKTRYISIWIILIWVLQSQAQIGSTLRTGICDNSAPPFISSWNTANTSTGSSAVNTIILPLIPEGSYEFTIDWGDGNVHMVSNVSEGQHVYASPGIYTITITGCINGWKFNNTGDRLKLLDIMQWGCLEGAGYNSFYGCGSLTTVSANDTINLTGLTSLSGQFRDCSAMTSIDVSNWDVSGITNVGNQFNGCTSLTTLDVSNWDVGAMMSLNGQFMNCSSLTTLDVSNWDVSSGVIFNGQFQDCVNLTTLDVSSWVTSSATRMDDLFHGCSSLAVIDISNWDVSNVTHFNAMFWGCTSITSLDVSLWVMSSAVNFDRQFRDCTNLATLDVSNWDVSNATRFDNQFRGCSSLTTLDVSSWITSSAIRIDSQFLGCTSLTTLDVSNWDVSNVTRIDSQFKDCTSLAPVDISDWDVSNVINSGQFMSNYSGMTTAVYDQTLINWDALTLQPNLTVDFGNSQYTAGGVAEAARNSIIANDGWTIDDGGSL